MKAVKNLSLKVRKNEVIVFLGTSGSGKTTCIKMVNRLEEVTSGRILVQGTDLLQHDPISLQRKIGYAVQHIGLFPHMTVAENIATVPRLLKWENKRIDRRVQELLEMMGLFPDEFANRYPHQLSGGQQQRVGVARAVAADPDIMPMDEPWAPSPDMDSRMPSWICRSDSKKTVLFVTHDIFEAVKLGDRIALLDDGRLQQLDTPTRLIEKPANRFVQKFLGIQKLQLTLLTKSLKEIIDPNIIANFDQSLSTAPSATVSLADSLLEVLDTLRNAESEFVTIVDGSNIIARLKKDDIMAALSRFLKAWINA